MEQTKREPMALLLTIVGIVTLLVGLLWWPSGVGEWGWLTLKVSQNARSLEAEGTLPPDLPIGDLLAGVEQRLASVRALEAVAIFLSGLLETSCGLVWRRQRISKASPHH
jgi:uncharacterized membrane protein YphA (DoxX/SURF4 family)